MSDPGGERREWRCHIQDTIGFCEKVVKYTGGLGRDDFIANEMAHDAALRNLELVGEAATHVPASIREAHPEILWRDVIGMRNRLAHAYLGVDEDTVWTAARDDAPALLPALRGLLAAADEPPGGRLPRAQASEDA